MRHILSRLKLFLRDRQGLAAVEFALIAPVLVLLYFGTVDVANWYAAHRRLVVAGSTIADLTTQTAGTLKKSDITKMWTDIGAIVAPLDITKVTMNMRAYRKSGTSVQPLWPAVTVSGGPTCAIDPSAAQLASMGTEEMSDGNDILVVVVCSEIPTLAPLQIFNYDKLKLTYQINMRPRIGKTLACTGC